MQDTMNFLPLEDCDNPKSAHYIEPDETPFRFGRKKKIHRQMTKGEAFIQKGKDEMNKLYPRK